MEDVKIYLNGIESLVNGILFVNDGKYYFIYTSKEIDENGYVILHISKIGKEVVNTPAGVTDTGNMLGVSITDDAEWASVQKCISGIVNDKRNKTNSAVQYVSTTILKNLKIQETKTFRLKKELMINDFGLEIENQEVQSVDTNSDNVATDKLIVPTASTLNEQQPVNSEVVSNTNSVHSSDNLIEQQSEVILDYRTKFFEELEKNKELQATIDELNKKIENIKEILG